MDTELKMSYGRKDDGGKDQVYFITKEQVEEATSTASSEDSSQQAAYNPETKEINWDCPCLGGMANGPCGEDFKAAFSCFVFSEAEPKGADCISNFQNMQKCFQNYPEFYADQLNDDEDEGEEKASESISSVVVNESEKEIINPTSATEEQNSQLLEAVSATV